MDKREMFQGGARSAEHPSVSFSKAKPNAFERMTATRADMDIPVFLNGVRYRLPVNSLDEITKQDLAGVIELDEDKVKALIQTNVNQTGTFTLVDKHMDELVEQVRKKVQQKIREKNRAIARTDRDSDR